MIEYKWSPYWKWALGKMLLHRFWALHSLWSADCGCTDRFTGQAYLDIMMTPVVVLFAQRHRHSFILMDDNPRSHWARVVNDFLQQHQISHLTWPLMSPDLNPAEHLWDTLGRCLRAKPFAPGNIQVHVVLAGGIEPHSPGRHWQAYQKYVSTDCLNLCKKGSNTLLTDV